MRQYIALAILILSQFSWAQLEESNLKAIEIPNAVGYKNKGGILIPESTIIGSPNQNLKSNVEVDRLDIYANKRGILVPIKIGELQGAMAVTDPKGDPNALELFRHAINQEATKEHIQQQRDGWFKSANKRFSPETVTFFLATGMVIWASGLDKFHGDPLALERHILSLKDPIASASFYAFMQANGFYMNAKSNGLPHNLDPHTRAQMMRRFSYGGMVWGSLASSLIADIFSPFKPCLEKMLTKDYRFDKFLEEKCQRDLGSAYSSWTARNKFGQYGPQILSLVLSQKASEIATAGIHGVTSRLTATDIAKKYASKDAAKRFIFNITGVDALFTLVPGRAPVVVFRWVGKLTQFTGFMAIDHMISTPTYRAFNNLFRPTAFHFDAMKINRLWNLGDKYSWDENKAKLDSLECPVQVPDCMKFSDLPKEIENFSTQTQQWREHINAVNETDLAGWMEMSKKILNQVGLTYSFYKTYLNNLFDTLNVGHRIHTKQSDSEAINNFSRFPYRELPLYGVKFIEGTNSQVSINDQYLLAPHKMEKYQLAHIQDKIKKIGVHKQISSVVVNLSKKAQAQWSETLRLLSSQNVIEVGRALVTLNSIVGVYGIERQQKAGFLTDTQFTDLMEALRNTIGNPLPILHKGAGISQAFADSSGNLEMAREANFSWRGKTYTFNKDGDYLTYQMLCGNSQGALTNNWVFSDEFIPPRIVKNNSKPLQLCNSLATHVSSDRLYSLELTNTATKKTFGSITDYITEHLNYNSVLGDYRDNKNKGQFDIWWSSQVKESIRPRFQDFDLRFKQLAEKNREVLLGTNKSALNKVLDATFNWGQYLPSSLLNSFMWELEVYLDLVQSVATSNKASNEPNYLLAALKKSKLERSSGVYGARVAELNELNLLFNEYIKLLQEPEITFEQYGEVSSKIKSMITSIKTKTGADQSAESKNVFAAEPAEKVSDDKTEIVKIDFSKNSTKHKVAVAAIQGLTMLEAELRRFLRMKLLLSQTLDIDTKEFNADMGSDDKSQKSSTKVRSAGRPQGQ